MCLRRQIRWGVQDFGGDLGLLFKASGEGLWFEDQVWGSRLKGSYPHDGAHHLATFRHNCCSCWVACLKGPRTQIVELQGPNTIIFMVFWYKALLFGPLALRVPFKARGLTQGFRV